MSVRNNHDPKSGRVQASLLTILALLINPLLRAQTASEPADFARPAKVIVAPIRYAWCSALAPDETWIATGYGLHLGDAGMLRVWDLKSGKVRWEAREDRGVRGVAISPDGSLVASGNYGGEIRLRDAATGEVRQMFGDKSGSAECLSFSSDGRCLVSGGNRTGRALRIWDRASGQMLKTLEGHTAVVYAVQFSPDDKLVVSGGRDGTARIWSVEDGGLKHTITHPNEVTGAVFLGGSTQVATICTDGQARVFDAGSGGLVKALAVSSQQQAPAHALAATGDGAMVATGDGVQIQLWETREWKSFKTLNQERSFAWGLVFAKDGKTLISSNHDSSVRVWDVAGQRQTQVFAPPASEQMGAGRVRAMSLSSDGKLLATANGGPQVELRDWSDGKVIRALRGSSAITAVAFTPDGAQLAAGGADGLVSLWDVKSGTALDSLKGHTGRVNAVAWTANSKLLASGGEDKTVRLWDAMSRKQIAAMDGHAATVHAVAFSPDGKRLVSGSEDFTARVWDVEKQTTIATLKGHAAAVNAVAMTSHGKTIATGSNDGSARLWEGASYRQRAVLDNQEAIVSVAFSPSGATLASGGEHGSLRVWDVARGKQQKKLSEHTAAVTGLAFLPDGSGLISSSMDQSIRLRTAEAAGIGPLITISGHRPEALGAAFSPDGKWLLTTGADRMVTIRDPANGAVRRVLRGHTNRVYRAVISADSTQAASVSSDGTVRIWSILRGEQVGMFNAWKDKFAAARAVALSPDGRTVASGADDGTIKVWSVAEKKEIQVLTGQALPVSSLAFLPDGLTLVSCTGDWRNNREAGELRLWEAASGKELARLEGHAGEIKCIAVDPGGKWLASSGSDRTVRLWSLADRAQRGSFQLDASGAALGFSPDGNRLAVGDSGGGVSVWEVSAATLITRYAGHAKSVSGVAFSPDGKRLATAGHDGVISLWPVASDEASPMK